MGLTSSNPFTNLFARKEVRITIAGLNDAGATTILYRIKYDKLVSTTITIGTLLSIYRSNFVILFRVQSGEN